jgi:Ca2+-binding RTX toxin-like protein
MPITASYIPATFSLTVNGTTVAEEITIDRTVAGTLRVNGGAVPITGGPATVANTDLIEVAGGGGSDSIALNEANGALPAAELSGGNGNDTLTGGSGGDLLLGEAGNDTLFGRGGQDQLYGGTANDTLTGGDGDDQMFGEAGDDLMIWNPGDDSDLMEGGDGDDTVQVNGGAGGETFVLSANGTRVRFDRIDPAPFALDIGTSETFVLNAGAGDDVFSASGNIAALIGVTVDGGTGNDTLLGSNGADLLIGGDGNDFVDGQQDSDTIRLGASNDTAQWDPRDGSDIFEGGAGTDTLLFNASAGNEDLTVSANGSRTQLTRNVGNIDHDINDIERITLNALAGTDTIAIRNLNGTDVDEVAIDLASTIGGTAGDGAADNVAVTGTGQDDNIVITGTGTTITVSGLPALVRIANSEGANDFLTIIAAGGHDTITATALPAGMTKFTIDGGTGNDSIFGSQGADTILAGTGNDLVFGDNGNDLAFLGTGNDTFQWEAGDGNDIIEGQDGTDTLRFIGSNASETITISPNGGRVIFFRDVAAVTMDMDDVERIRFRALGGVDKVIVSDMSGTDLTDVAIDLKGPSGSGDGAADEITVNATLGVDGIEISGTTTVEVSGLHAVTQIVGAEVANDRLVLNGQGGNDTINASGLNAGLIQLTINGGLGSDAMMGSKGGDLINGGDGNDLALMGAGNDTFVWNPGDDNDSVEGQGGTDTLQFNASAAPENITIFANGARVIVFRDIAAVTLDLNDVERIRIVALGGADERRRCGRHRGPEREQHCECDQHQRFGRVADDHRLAWTRRYQSVRGGK